MWFKESDNLYHDTGWWANWSPSSTDSFMRMRSCQRLFDARHSYLKPVESEQIVAIVDADNAEGVVCKDCWNKFVVNSYWEIEDIRHRLAEKQSYQKRCALVAQKEAEGKSEIKPGNLVTLLDLETGEECVYYFVVGEVHACYYNCIRTFEDNTDIPTLPLGVDLLRTASPVGRVLAGRFVGDEFTVTPVGGPVTYRIIDMKPLLKSSARTPMKNTTGISEDRAHVYEGRGKSVGNDSEGIDGSKYLGYTKRDNGQWGSFPMHDDYGDESDAEGKDYGEWEDYDAE